MWAWLLVSGSGKGRLKEFEYKSTACSACHNFSHFCGPHFSKRKYSMKRGTVQEAKEAMVKNGKHWRIPFLEFVDDLRRSRNHDLIKTPFPLGNERFDSISANLCD